MRLYVTVGNAFNGDYDRANGRVGAYQKMAHLFDVGDKIACLSVGCIIGLDVVASKRFLYSYVF